MRTWFFLCFFNLLIIYWILLKAWYLFEGVTVCLSWDIQWIKRVSIDVRLSGEEVLMDHRFRDFKIFGAEDIFFETRSFLIYRLQLHLKRKRMMMWEIATYIWVALRVISTKSVRIVFVGWWECELDLGRRLLVNLAPRYQSRKGIWIILGHAKLSSFILLFNIN